MRPLRSQLSALANDFADAVLAAIRSASLQELLSESGASPGHRRSTKSAPAARRAAGPAAAPRVKLVGGRLARRSPASIEETLGRVVAALKAPPGEGMRSEEIREFLKLDKRELPRVLKAGLEKKVLRSKGQKRATTYFAA